MKSVIAVRNCDNVPDDTTMAGKEFHTVLNQIAKGRLTASIFVRYGN